MTENNFSPTIRIEKIELKNIKGVKHGIIEFNCLKNPAEKDTCSDILGIYGQNGSGKTTLLEALHVTKLAMMGSKIPFTRYGNIISQETGYARIAVTFQVSNSDGSYYHLEYAFSLISWKYPDLTEIFDEESKNKKTPKKGTKRSALLSAFAAGVTASTIAATTAAAAVTAPWLLPGSFAAGGLGLSAGIVARNIMKHTDSERDSFKSKENVEYLSISDEVLNLSGMFDGSAVRQGPVLYTGTADAAFLPKSRQKSFFPNKTASVMRVLEKHKQNTFFDSRSFVFSDELSQLLLEQNQITEYAQIILNLKAFAIQKLRIIGPGLDSADRDGIIPLYTASREIGIRKSDSTTFIDDDGLQTLKKAIKTLNIVLHHVIPGLSLDAVRQVDVDIVDQNNISRAPGNKVTVYSVRDSVRIPLAEESAGIIRLISSICLFTYAFANKDVTVAIDEIDAGVYEYLLGELLLIFEEYGAGQLIFTCHNLRPMEVLNKKYIYFTTTNSENRYLKPKSIRNENNLRDVYLKEIIAGGQEEELYTTAKHGKIAAALQKAGDLLAEE